MAGLNGAVGCAPGLRLTVLLKRALVVLLALVVLGLSWWAWNVGPATALAIVRYNFTGIDDYQVFPGRALAASTQAQPFDLGAHVALDGRLPVDGFTDLEHLLEATRTVSYLVVRDGEIVYERYLDGRDETTPAQVFSVSKSILSALVGAALADGHIDSLEQPVTDFVPELADAGFGEVTLEHLLQMTSGMDYTDNDNPFGEHAMFAYTRRLEAEVLDLRLAEPPDGQWSYKSGDTALLSLALARAVAPRTLTDYLHEALWAPMGMEHDGVWSTDREGGLERSWCCLAGTARDLAKFGRLYLENSRVDGNQVLPAAWIRASTTLEPAQAGLMPPLFADAGHGAHHYHWWLLDAERGDYAAMGHLGQFLYIDPATNTVVVRQGHGPGGVDWLGLFRWTADHGAGGGMAPPRGLLGLRSVWDRIIRAAEVRRRITTLPVRTTRRMIAPRNLATSRSRYVAALAPGQEPPQGSL